MLLPPLQVLVVAPPAAGPGALLRLLEAEPDVAVPLPVETLCADSADAALAHIQHGAPALVLLDTRLRDPDAQLLCERIQSEAAVRADSAALAIVLVHAAELTAPVDAAVTADEAAAELRAFAAGAIAYLGPATPTAVARARIAVLLRQQVTADQALRRHESRWTLALQCAEQGVWEWDLLADQVFVSPQWRVLIGEPPFPGRLDAADWRARIHPDDLAERQARLDRHRAGLSVSHDSEHRLRLDDGRVIWVHEAGRVIARDDAKRPLRMIGMLSDISRRKDAEARALSLAYYDPITELPNRLMLLDHLRAALSGPSRSGARPGALCLVDLDHFKLINDTSGHETGDQMLREAALRLRSCLGPHDLLARLGGDEFVVLLAHPPFEPASGANGPHADGPDEARLLSTLQSFGASVLGTLATPYRLGEQDHHGGASIGVVVIDANHQADEPELLLKWADIALYEAKRAGRGCLRVFDPAMQAAVHARSVLDAELRAALAEGQFEMAYQIQVGAGNRAFGAEALVRWQHPQRGTIHPIDFIGLAEETGLIVPLGRVLLRLVCEQLTSWSTDPNLSHLTVSFNVSPRELHEPDFVDHVLATLEITGAPVRRLKLELTESALVGDVDDIAARMQRLRAHGVGFSLDDFGTGFSSLAYLKRLPFDQLKIDRSFVRDILDDSVDAHLSRAIVALAASLELDVVAEGVELAAQGEMLREFGCNQFQGYFYGMPMAAPAFELSQRAALH